MAGTTLGTLVMEAKTNQMSLTCMELPVQPGVKHIIGAQLRNLRLYMPQTPTVTGEQCEWPP